MGKKISVRRNRFLVPVAICMAILLFPFPIAAKEGMLFILDCSGSMWGRVNDIPKIVLAKEALLSVVSEIPEDVEKGALL